MATTQTAWTEEEKYENLSELYLTLWKQLDLLLGENRFLDVRPLEPRSLKEQAMEVLERVRRFFPDAGGVVEKDFHRVQVLVDGTVQQSKPEVERLKEYLRDQGIRYAEGLDS